MDFSDDTRARIEWLLGQSNDEEEHSAKAEAEEEGNETGDVDDDAEDELELELVALAESDETEDQADHDLDFEWEGQSIRETDVDELSTRVRDEKIDEYDGDALHTEIREHVRDRGIAEELEDMLADIATETHDSTDAEGDVLDMRNVIRRLAGDTTVDEYYRRPTQYPSDDLAVGVSVDMSGSMSSYELEAKAAVGAFLFAVDQLGGTVVANAWQYDRGTNNKIQMLTAPGERFRWDHLDAVEPDGGDPIARGMRHCGELLRRTTASEQLLFVISDGNPTVESLPDQNYDSPIDEAEYVAENLRRRGVTVTGVGFGRVREENLEAMFGEENSYHVPLEELADTLADGLLDELGRSMEIAI